LIYREIGFSFIASLIIQNPYIKEQKIKFVIELTIAIVEI